MAYLYQDKELIERHGIGVIIGKQYYRIGIAPEIGTTLNKNSKIIKITDNEIEFTFQLNSLFLFSFQIYSNCPLKRNRFLLMLLFPNIVLALIPLFFWYCGIVFISPFISRIIGSLLTILFTCGASDYSLFFDTILCTKKEDNIIIFKNEFYSS